MNPLTDSDENLSTKPPRAACRVLITPPKIRPTFLGRSPAFLVATIFNTPAIHPKGPLKGRDALRRVPFISLLAADR